MALCYAVRDALRERRFEPAARVSARVYYHRPSRFRVATDAQRRLIPPSMIAGLILFVIATVYRLLPWILGFTTPQPDWFVNVSPVAAMLLCGAALFPQRLAVAIPFLSLLLTDLILNAHYGFPLVNSLLVAKTLAFAAIAAFGWQLRSHARLSTLLPAAIGGSIFFYVVTNTASWLYDPLYAKNVAGWTQALTTGLSGYQPTWTFLRNSCISDVTFTLLFFLCVRPSDALAGQEKAAAAAW
jgi:hypothetical protein